MKHVGSRIRQLVNGMEDLIRRSAGPGIRLEVIGAGALWTTIIDPNQLENALLNLCINALPAKPRARWSYTDSSQCAYSGSGRTCYCVA